MHDQIPLITSTSVIIVGILAGIFFNQRGLDKLESRLDRLESRMDKMHSELSARIDRISDDLKHFYRTLGEHDEAIDTLKKRST
jgi:Mg2+ and Co2+ transporter CorA